MFPKINDAEKKAREKNDIYLRGYHNGKVFALDEAVGALKTIFKCYAKLPEFFEDNAIHAIEELKENP